MKQKKRIDRIRKRERDDLTKTRASAFSFVGRGRNSRELIVSMRSMVDVDDRRSAVESARVRHSSSLQSGIALVECRRAFVIRGQLCLPSDEERNSTWRLSRDRRPNIEIKKIYLLRCYVIVNLRDSLHFLLTIAVDYVCRGLAYYSLEGVLCCKCTAWHECLMFYHHVTAYSRRFYIFTLWYWAFR